jgi:hypothetical protein
VKPNDESQRVSCFAVTVPARRTHPRCVARVEEGVREREGGGGLLVHGSFMIHQLLEGRARVGGCRVEVCYNGIVVMACACVLRCARIRFFSIRVPHEVTIAKLTVIYGLRRPPGLGSRCASGCGLSSHESRALDAQRQTGRPRIRPGSHK